MSTFTPIQAMLYAALALAACNTSPSGIAEPGGAALLVVAPSSASIPEGGTLRLNVTAHDENGIPTLPSDVVWSTSNPKVAAVAVDGTVTGQGAGKAVIAAWWNGVHGVSTVAVVGPDAGLPKCPNQPGHPLLSLIEKCIPR